MKWKEKEKLTLKQWNEMKGKRKTNSKAMKWNERKKEL
jgi:hypothetical protein